MATIKGENLRVMVGDDTEHLGCIAASTNCVAHAAVEMGEDTTKDTTGDWVEREPVSINWDVQVDALVLSDGDEDYRPDAVSADQLQIGRVYQLRFTHTAGAAGQQNRDAIADGMQLTGAAILSDISINAQNADVATYTARFTGTGELEPYTPSE